MARAIPAASHRYGVGVALLLVVVVLWTAANFVTQYVFDEGFEKPFLVTYLNTASFSLYLLPFIVRCLRDRTAFSSQRPEYSPLAGGLIQEPSITESASSSSLQSASSPLTTKETLNLASAFAVLWFVANWTVNVALQYTSVASATILASTSGFFTLLVGRLFHTETLTLTRVLAVVVSFIGVVFVSKGDATSLPLPPGHPSVPGALATRAIEVPVDRPNALLGDCLALMSAICYALYVIFLKLRIRDESRIDMRLFFGFVGLVNICVGWIGIVLFHLLNIESFELPSTGRQVRGIVLNMFITFLSDYIYVLAMLKTTPLIVTVGLSLTIPCALLGELLLHVKAPLQVVWGAILVVVAFAVIGVEDIWDSLWQKQRSSQC